MQASMNFITSFVYPSFSANQISPGDHINRRYYFYTLSTPPTSGNSVTLYKYQASTNAQRVYFSILATGATPPDGIITGWSTSPSSGNFGYVYPA